MKVYCVFHGEYSDRTLIAVYSDKKKAEEAESYYSGEIEEHEVDSHEVDNSRGFLFMGCRYGKGDIVVCRESNDREDMWTHPPKISLKRGHVQIFEFNAMARDEDEFKKKFEEIENKFYAGELDIRFDWTVRHDYKNDADKWESLYCRFVDGKVVNSKKEIVIQRYNKESRSWDVLKKEVSVL